MLNRLNAIYIFIFFLAFYMLSFSTGECFTSFNSIDGKVEYEQMKDIVNGDYSLLLHPRKHLGISLFEIPLYLIGESASKILKIPLNPPFTLLVNSLATAFGCLIYYLILAGWTDELTSVILTLIYGLTTLAWPYAKSDTTDPILASLLLATFWSMIRYKDSGKMKWFVIAAVFAFFMYVTKLVAHIFLPGLILYTWFIERKRKSANIKVAGEILALILVWVLVLPVSMNVNKVHAGAYTWSWFHEMWYKIAVLEFSPFKGLFIYNTVLIMLVFSIWDYVKKYRDEFIVIFSLVLPYLSVLHFGKEFFSIHSFGCRYHIVATPLLLLMLFPFIEEFNAKALYKRMLFIATVVVGFYVQLLGASIGSLYYAHMITGCLGMDWRQYVFSFHASPFGVYPLLILRTILGIEMPVRGFNNVSSSIIAPLQANYFIVKNSSWKIALVAVVISVICAYSAYAICSRAGIIERTKKYIKRTAIIMSVLIGLLLSAFIDKNIFNHKDEQVEIENNNFEVFDQGNRIPSGWHIIDWSSEKGKPSIEMRQDMMAKHSGNASLQMLMKQDYVTISLYSTGFEVKKNEIIEARCNVKGNYYGNGTVRIVFHNAQNEPFYYSATTRSRKVDDNWDELVSTVVAPDGAVKAHLFLNVWGGGVNNQVLNYDNVRVVKRI